MLLFDVERCNAGDGEQRLIEMHLSLKKLQRAGHSLRFV